MKKSFHLTEEDIDSIMEDTRAYLVGRKVADREVLKLELFFEEALLRYRDKFGREQEVIVETSDFFITKVLIKVKADGFNPIEADDESILSSEYLQNLMAIEGSYTNYRYWNGYNEIVAIARRESKAKAKLPGGAITIAVLLAVAASLLTKQLPAETADLLINTLAAPTLSKIMGLIMMVTAPLICISVISGICALGDIATLSSIGLKAIGRFVVITVMLITFSVLVCLLIFPGISAATNGAFDISDIVGMLLALIPQDIVSPFVEGNTIQIIVIAAAIGVAILMLGEKCRNLSAIISELNQLLFTIMGFVSKLIPIAVFLSIYKAVALNSLTSIVSVWKLVLANYAAMVPFTAGMVLYVCVRRRLDVKQFLHVIAPSAIVGFTTASGTLAMTKSFEVARDGLKKDEKLVSFWIPLSHAMFSPSVIPSLVGAAFYAGNYYGTAISIPQILIMYILVTQLSISSPKVPGGIMATYTILMGQLGMPEEVVGLLMVANVFVVNALTGLAMVIRSAELEDFSHTIKL